MISLTHRLRARLLCALFLTASCAGAAADESAGLPEALANASYDGTEYGTVTLTDGQWEGEPWVAGGASRPRVGLAKDFLRYGDVDGDGDDEALVLLWESSGGSGTFNYIALVDRRDGEWRNTATTALGDRVKVTDARLAPGLIEVFVIEHDDDDPACCPTRHATRRFDPQLQALAPSEGGSR
jgi:hypothetical protein